MAAEKCGVCPFEAMDLLWFHQIVTSTKSPSKNISLISVRVSNQQTSSEVASSEVENKKQESEETTTTTKSHSSSTTTRTSMRKSRSSVDLELQEVKGFMDLGFVFKKHNLSSHVISLIPGLQRIKSQDDQDFDEEREGKVMMVPESWLVNLPNSPLILSLRISRVCNDSDTVKKHLKDWARTVATTVHQES
ncbi:hypothetical protein AAHA92_01643 [Salvia divinorum]|uniref:Uncharacterized protein n=1 Tax=Salvia divinorum TaxID=28513 RepID=A0ABD1IC95_SALDI